MTQRIHNCRNGITILEVLIAMGIALFGLLAVMAIVPFAATQARQGLETEEAVAVGQRAMADVHTHGLLNPRRWLTISASVAGGPLAVDRITDFKHTLEPAYNTTGHSTDAFDRLFWDEAILIDPQFFNTNAVSHFPYTYAPQGFVDDENGLAGVYRDPLVAGGAFQGYTSQGHAGGGDPFEAIAPYVRRVGLTNPAYAGDTTIGMMPDFFPLSNPIARQIFETNDDVELRTLNDVERAAVTDFEQMRRAQYYETFDTSGNPLATKLLSQGRTSWLVMLVPEDVTRTTWRMSIIILRDRDPAFGIDLVNERVARIRGTGRYGVGTGFLSGGVRGGVVRIESWGTTGLGASPPETPIWHVQEHDVQIAANQWVLLSQFEPSNVSDPNQPGKRTYRWYRAADVGADIFESPAGVHANSDVAGPVPARLVTLVGPDWNPAPDTLVFMMNNVEAVYERTIHMPPGSFPAAN